jgi:hypothetical protein
VPSHILPWEISSGRSTITMKRLSSLFLRGVAFANLHDSRNASGDIKSAVDLDPSLAHYVTINGKTASLALPPL